MLLDWLPDGLRSRVDKVFKRHVKPLFNAMGLRNYYFGSYSDWYIDQVLKKFVSSTKSLALEHFPHLEEEKIIGTQLSLDWSLIRKSKGIIRLPLPEKDGGLVYDKDHWVTWTVPRWRVPKIHSSFGDGDLEGYLR
jgi:hypothetical protein